MRNLECRGGAGPTRRDFLRAGSLAVGLSFSEWAVPTLRAERRGRADACIQLFLTGGPSQLDTWDPKPDAPSEIRGPFRPIRTRVPCLYFSEHFPRMAERAERFAVLRSVFHEEAPIHETGQQLVQTGALCRSEVEWPHVGAVLSHLRPAGDVPAWVVVPGPLGDTGVRISHGQGAGFLGAGHEACPDPEVEVRFRRAVDLRAEPERARDRYGRHAFGRNCLRARRLVEAGVGLVTINMFDTVFGKVTWDCHANGGDLSTTLDDYAATLCPMLDQAYTALLDDLHALGRLDRTLVVAAGEFGRTPKVNANCGRDHWPGVWSVLLAGGGVRGGQVIGRSDRHGAEPIDRPIHASQIAETMFHALGIEPAPCFAEVDGQRMPLVASEPVLDVF